MTALDANPDRPKAHYNIATVYLQKGQVDQAIAHFEKELQIQPDYADAHNDLAIALSQKGRMREAIVHWQKALELKPDNMNAQCNLAWVFSTYPEPAIRNGPKAVDLAKRALELSSDRNPRILRLLAAAYAESSRFPEAIDAAQTGLEVATAQGNAVLRDTLRMKIDLFRANIPLRDTHQVAAPR